MSEKKPQSPTLVLTDVVRISFVSVWKPKAMLNAQGQPQGDPKYQVSVIIPKSNTALMAKINAAVDAAREQGKAKWGGKIPANLKLPVRDGDVDRPDDPAYKDSWFFTASSKEQPGIVDLARVKIPHERESEIYSGVYVRLSLNFYPFNPPGVGAKGIACGLNHIQKVKDGEPLAGRGSAEQAFDDDFIGEEPEEIDPTS